MKNLVLLLVFISLIFSCQEKTKTLKTEEQVNLTEEPVNVSLDVYNFNEFERFLNKRDNTTYILNFWATWCAPCVKELPYFEEVNQKYDSQNVEVILVSLDMPKQYEKKLIPFIKDNNLKSKVIALNDTKMNDWIPKVDADWSGAIPATIIYKNDNSQFYERSFTLEELENELKKFITP